MDTRGYVSYRLVCKEKKRETMKQIIVQVNQESMEIVSTFVETELEKAECDFQETLKIMIAVDEIYSNIIKYSHAAYAEVMIERKDKKIALTFKDNGVKYNPLEKEDPDVTVPLEERIPGGWGIFIVKNSMDDVKYIFKDGMNILTLYKCIKKTGC